MNHDRRALENSLVAESLYYADPRVSQRHSYPTNHGNAQTPGNEPAASSKGRLNVQSLSSLPEEQTRRDQTIQYRTVPSFLSLFYIELSESTRLGRAYGKSKGGYEIKYPGEPYLEIHAVRLALLYLRVGKLYSLTQLQFSAAASVYKTWFTYMC